MTTSLTANEMNELSCVGAICTMRRQANEIITTNDDDNNYVANFIGL